MTLARFKANNHPQQVDSRGAIASIDDRATHPLNFGPLHDRFGFTIDVAAAPHNTKCDRFYDVAMDGLAQSWANEMVWCNPPYSDIAPWVRKAWDQHNTARGIVMLLPANRTEQQWWQLMVEPFRDRAQSPLTVEFLPGRMRFLKPGQTAVGPNERPPFGCLLLIWSPPTVYRADRVTGGLFGDGGAA